MAHAMPQVSGVDHRWVRVNDVKFHVAEAGPEDAPPVFLLHGWPQHWYAWRLVIPPLAESHRVVAMDLRGFGWSDIAWTGFEKESMADDVAGVIAEVGLEDVTFVGHDWGAWIGYLLAMKRPELLSRLVGISTPPPLVKPSPKTVLALARFRYQLLLASPLGVRVQSNPRYVTSKIKRWSKVGKHFDREARRIYGRDLRASTRARATMLLYRTFLTRELAPVIAGRYRDEHISVPTKILFGLKDPILRPSLYEGLEPYFEDLELRPVPKAGHFVPEEQPDDVIAAILDGAAG